MMPDTANHSQVDVRLPCINQVALAGRLAEEPVFTINEWGEARLRSCLAVRRAQRNQDGQWEEESCCFRITMQAALAEHLSETLHKDMPVFVAGRLRSGPDGKEVEILVRNLQQLQRPLAETGG